jgi:hypothetical protein
MGDDTKNEMKQKGIERNRKEYPKEKDAGLKNR